MTVQLVGKTNRKLVEDDLSLIQLPLELFNPCRMIIMQCLMRHGNVEFRQLKYAIPGITDGNLASHLKVLEQSGYIEVHKEIIDRKIRTSYEITKEGKKDFKQLRDVLIEFYKKREDDHV